MLKLKWLLDQNYTILSSLFLLVAEVGPGFSGGWIEDVESFAIWVAGLGQELREDMLIPHFMRRPEYSSVPQMVKLLHIFKIVK